MIRRSPEIVAADPFFPAFMAGVVSVLARQGRVLVFSVVWLPAAQLTQGDSVVPPPFTPTSD